MTLEKIEDVERSRFLRDLSEKGYEDVLVLKRGTAKEVLTDKRMELVKIIEEEELDSVRELARRTGRDPGMVSKDLKRLYESEIVEFREEEGRKIPMIAHENILVEPIILGD